MDNELVKLQNKLREIVSTITVGFEAKHNSTHTIPFELTGYSGATLSLIVQKKAEPEFIFAQVDFMRYLGNDVCPKILGVNADSYTMEYLYPFINDSESLVSVEKFLQKFVWCRNPNWIVPNKANWHSPIPDWALGSTCVIHGDPTCDNLLFKPGSGLRITDPIPPTQLRKPSIQAVDHGKMLQSFLGWESVLRGTPVIEYEWPLFMQEYESARRAVFWALVSMRRICYRNYDKRISNWAVSVAWELEELCELSS